MENQTTGDIWTSAYRAYVLVRVGVRQNKVEVAHQIYALNQGLDVSKAFIIRACVVASDYDIVVPVCARDLGNLHEVVDLIINQMGVDAGNSSILFLESELGSDAYNPSPPQDALGYVPLDEANPTSPGPTGFNYWG